MYKFAILLSAALLLGPPAKAASPNVRAAMQAYLDAYARGDAASVVAMSASHGLHVYGSDASEFVSGTDGLRRMLADDQHLWSGKAHFGAMRNVTSEHSGDLATVFFDDDFILGATTVPVRFATVWRLENGTWKLLQSSNVVPTTGQSAAVLSHSQH